MYRQKIVVIEDDPVARQAVQDKLSREGFGVVTASRGDDGLRCVLTEAPDMVLLEAVLPGLGGIDVCRQLRQETASRAVPIIMVSALDDERDIVRGLDAGADDYVTKPFRSRELIARIRAVLRRFETKEVEYASGRIVRDQLVIDSAWHEVRVAGESVRLTVTEFRLLHFLASHPGRVFTRDQLVNRVMGRRAVVTDRNIDVHIRSIRTKLGEYHYLIGTVYGVGYRFQD